MTVVERQRQTGLLYSLLFAKCDTKTSGSLTQFSSSAVFAQASGTCGDHWVDGAEVKPPSPRRMTAIRLRRVAWKGESWLNAPQTFSQLS